MRCGNVDVVLVGREYLFSFEFRGFVWSNGFWLCQDRDGLIRWCFCPNIRCWVDGGRATLGVESSDFRHGLEVVVTCVVEKRMKTFVMLCVLCTV
jgi:hypothetical protein